LKTWASIYRGSHIWRSRARRGRISGSLCYCLLGGRDQENWRLRCKRHTESIKNQVSLKLLSTVNLWTWDTVWFDFQRLNNGMKYNVVR
jgi:hypothetical protein